MNDYSKQRWEKLSAILGDDRIPLSERMDTAFDTLEAEIRGAFERGVRIARQHERTGFTSRCRTSARSRFPAPLGIPC